MNKEFQVHMLSDLGKTRAVQVAVAFDTLLDTLINTCSAGRELALVKTKLEEACFFAKKSLTSDPANIEKLL